MIKAVKECLKNWLVTHERLYWYIIVGLAVFAFGLVTALGCAKLEKANAAEVDVISVPWFNEMVDISTEGQSYYFIQYGCPYSNSGTRVYLSNTPFVGYWKASDIFILSLYDSFVTYGQIPSYEDKPVIDARKYYGAGGEMGTFFTDYACNCDIVDSNGNLLLSAKPYRSTVYSPDAPYFSFQNVIVDNRITDRNTGMQAFSTFYEDYTKTSTWKYMGHLNNTDALLDKSYSMDVVFTVQLPTIDYVIGQYHNKGVEIDTSIEESISNVYNVLKYGAEIVDIWNNNKKAPFLEYEFEYIVDIVPDANGNFMFQFSFDEIENMIKYFNPDALTAFQGYSEYFRSIYMSFVHVECLTATVKTTRDDTILYGKITTNQFERGIYDVCIEVIPEIDINTATPEEIEQILSDAQQDAYDKYVKDLENRLNEIESQLGGMTSVGSSFGDLEGSDLWSGFKSLAEGLGGLGPAINSLSGLIGSVFAFLPLQITAAICFTLFAICIIAIIKAIRG